MFIITWASIISIHILHKIMKKEINLSFKKWKPRPNSINRDEIDMKRRLFWIKLSKMLQEKILIANIDESTIGRNSQITYSWSERGTPSEFKNQPFTGSLNIVLTILSNGAWFWMLINKTINSEGFSEYASRFNDWIIENGTFGYRKVVLMLDNCSRHRSGDCMRLFKSLKHQIVFIPAYSPQFAPVEMCFNIVKQRMKSKARYTRFHSSKRFGPGRRGRRRRSRKIRIESD